MKAKKNKRQRSEQIQQVSAALGDLLGITQWRKEHPKATWAEIEAMVEESLARLGSWMPFESAQELLEDLVGIQVSKATARRAALAVDEAEVEQFKRDLPEAPGGAAKQ